MNKCLLFGFIFLIVIAFFGIFIRTEYATDTYGRLAIGPDNYKSFNSNGRYLASIWWAILAFFNCGINKIYFTSFLIAIICLVTAIYKLFKIIKNSIQNDFLSLILSLFIIINPFIIELFLFIEKGILIMSILFSILALEQFVLYLQDNKKKHIIFGIIFMFLNNFSYQGTLALFPLLGGIFIVSNSKNIKEFFKNNIIMFLIYGIPTIISRIFITNARAKTTLDIAVMMRKFIDGLKIMLKTFNIWPKFLFCILFLILAITLLIIIICNKKSIKTKLFNIFSFIYITAIGVVLPNLPILLTANGYMPRTVYAFASIIGCLTLFLIIINIEAKKINSLLAVLTIATLFLTFCRFNTISTDHYILNAKERDITLRIGDLIYAYEVTNNTKVTKVSFYHDQNTQGAYLDMFQIGSVNQSAYTASWADYQIVNYFNNLDLQKVDNNEEIKNHFASVDFNYFTDENVIIIGDTVHICAW